MCNFSKSLAALIPLNEFSDPGIVKKYGVKPDPETLDLLNCAAREKEVILFIWPSNVKKIQNS